jgi:hypothetical protein
MTQQDPVAGRTGVLTLGTPGSDGAGEVRIRARDGSRTFRAYSREPLAAGTTVLVVETRSGAAVEVVAWSDPFLSTAGTARPQPG